MKIESLVRDNIRVLRPYSSARHEFEGSAEVFLDANESPYPSTVNRYPDPLQRDLKKRISTIKKIGAGNIFLGNGSDEGIDLMIRIFCNPGKDKIIITPPTYGMYQVCADISDVGVIKVPLKSNFQPDVDEILSVADSGCKILFLCSPNNPTGTLINHQILEKLITKFKGLVVLDEAYADFAKRPSWIQYIDQYENLVILQTFSKAWGMAGIRLGLVLASKHVIHYLNAVKPPYNVNILTQKLAAEVLENPEAVNGKIKLICQQREWLRENLEKLPIVEKVFESEANFLLVRFDQSDLVFAKLKESGVVVRDRSSVEQCEGCLRITIGLPEENERVLEVLKRLS